MLFIRRHRSLSFFRGGASDGGELIAVIILTVCRLGELRFSDGEVDEGLSAGNGIRIG